MKAVAAHKFVAHLAEELAQTIYEEKAKDNDWYATHKDRKAFVRMLAPEMVPHAKSTMVDLLARDDVSESDKAEIFDALCMDAVLPKGGASVTH